jgi:UDP-sulfoquinovose synthase
MARIAVLGGDGFCGWPTALGLSRRGNEVAIVDNLSRRRIDAELGISSLTPITTLPERLAAWREVSGHTIPFFEIDVAQDYEKLAAFLDEFRPDAVVHFAEQRAAPYSMKSPRHKRYTVDNNVNATHNLLCAIVESGRDIHVVHLGTMGVYGYTTAGGAIPEGYLPVYVDIEGALEKREILHPTNPGSIYHMTKALDQLLFAYYNKNDKLRVTDLHQGIVWGTSTEECDSDPRLINRFDYDGEYGTVLNRFLMQASIGHPLTVHGSGGQKRAFIHIRDTVRCIALAIDSPPVSGDRVRIFNQMTEVRQVRALAELVAEMTGTEIAFLENPRNEAEANELEVENTGLLGLGLQPTRLRDELMREVMEVARRYVDRCDRGKIEARSKWVIKPLAPAVARPKVADGAR